MGVGSGIGAQLGQAAETVYGTYVAPTSFVPFTGAPLKRAQVVTTPATIGAGRFQELGADRIVTTHGAAGDVATGVYNKGMGLLVQALMGTTVTPVVNTAISYTQTHILADSRGKSVTLQVGVPSTNGTSNPYSYTGCKVHTADFMFEVAKEVTVKFGIDAQNVTETNSLVTASFGTGLRPFVGTDSSVKVGTYGSEASVTGVTKVDVKIDRSLNLGLYYFGAAGLKSEPIIDNFAKITGTITADLVDKTVFADRFYSNSSFSLVLEAIGTVIETGFPATFRITLPGCYLDGDTPEVTGPGVISGAFPFVCLFDGTNLPKITIISTEATIV
jgi:hypothetical protein